MSTLKATNIQNPASSLVNMTTDTSGGVAFPQLTGLVKANGSSSVTAAVAGTDYLAPGSGGTKVLLNTLTASSSAALQDTTSLTATYPAYELEFINLKPSSATSQLQLQVYSGGVYKNTAYNYANTYTTSTGVASNWIGLSTSSPSTTAAAESGITGSLFVKSPSQTTMYKMINGFASWTTGDTNGSLTGQMMNLCSGYWGGGTGAVTGFQFIFSSGNISSGTIKVWGIA